jgi:tetratricopeptide (TPR) repeat protein
VELDEDSVATLQNRGQVYAEIGEADAALADLQRAYQLILSKHHAPPAMAYILSGRGLAYTLLGRFDEASEDFGRSIELCPDNPWVHYRLGLLHNQLGDRRAAALCLRLSLHLEEPQVPPVYRRRAAAYLREWGHIIDP